MGGMIGNGNGDEAERVLGLAMQIGCGAVRNAGVGSGIGEELSARRRREDGRRCCLALADLVAGVDVELSATGG